MPARLDWEIDDLEAPLPEGDQDPPPGPFRRWGVVAALLIAALAIGAGILAQVRQKQTEIEGELRAVIEVELTALENGDRDLFLDRQDSKDRRWLRAQEETFDRYHRQIGTAPWEDRSQHVAYTGRISNVRVKVDNGWALVEAARGESTWLELWSFHWSPLDGWYHVRFDPEWLGAERTIITQHMQFIFPEGDTDIVQILAREMEDWYDTLSVLTGTPVKHEPLNIEFTFRDPALGITPRVQWARDSLTLVSPSPHQGHLSEDDSPSLSLRRQMASLLAEALISQQTGVHPNLDLGPTVNALRDAFRDRAVSQLVRKYPGEAEWHISPTPFIDGLITEHGDQVMRQLITNLDHPQTLAQVLTAAGYELPNPEQRVIFHLAAVSRAFHDLDESSYRDLLDPRTDRAWRGFYTNQLVRRRDIAPIDQSWPPPLALYIKSVEFRDDMAWAEIETIQHDGKTIHQTQFFRQANDLWLLTAPDPDYFAKEHTTRTNNLIFTYFEPESIWFESGLPLALQDKLDQAAADLGVSTDGLTITVETTTTLGLEGWVSGRNPIPLTSPTITGWAINDSDSNLMPVAVPVLSLILQTLIQEEAQQDGRFLAVHVAAFIWELERLFPENVALLTWLGINVRETPIASLSDLWLAGSEDSGRDLSQTLISYRALLDFLSETYGLHVVPPLLENISDTDDLDTWLRLSIGHPLAEVEPLWETWVSLHTSEP